MEMLAKIGEAKETSRTYSVLSDYMLENLKYNLHNSQPCFNVFKL